MVRSQKELAIALSKLTPLASFDVGNEQYPISADLAADVLWTAYMRGDIEDKVVADLGCGNGILGYGAYLLGAAEVYLVDVDASAISVACANFPEGMYSCCDVRAFEKHVDTVVMNPPFGVQKRSADRVFLEVAFRSSVKVYSIHKIESKKFLETFAKEKGFVVDAVFPRDFVLPKLHDFHAKQKYSVAVGLWAFSKV